MTDEDADKLDAYLGDGTYEKFDELDGDARRQLARTKAIATMLWRYDTGFSVLAPYGTDWVEKVKSDFEVGFNLIKNSRFPDPAQFQQLFDVYPLAIDTASLQLDEAEGLGGAWLLSAFAGMKPFLLSAAVGKLRNELLELENLLREAEAKEVETQIKAGLGFAITTISLIVPGLGLISKLGLTTAEYFLADTSAAKTTKVTKGGLEVLEHSEKAGERVGHFAGKSAKVLTVTGYYFDAMELKHAGHKVEKIKKLLKETKEKYSQIVPKLRSARMAFSTFQNVLNQKMRSLRDDIYAMQRKRDEIASRHAYSKFTPVNWRIVTDWSKVKLR